ncbi:hypothetical protein Droror1_Dr00018221 [Drosera rotundifolia]
MRVSIPSHGDASVPVHPDETGNTYAQFVLSPGGLWINRSKISRSISNHIGAYFDGPYMVFKEVSLHTIDRCMLIDGTHLTQPHRVSWCNMEIRTQLLAKSSHSDFQEKRRKRENRNKRPNLHCQGFISTTEL